MSLPDSGQTQNPESENFGLGRSILMGAFQGGLVGGGATAGIALVVVALRSFVITAPLLREAMLATLLWALAIGAVGGAVAGLCKRGSQRAPGMWALGMLVGMVAAEFAWTGWDGQNITPYLSTGPIFWMARLPGLMTTLAGCVAGAAGYAFLHRKIGGLPIYARAFGWLLPIGLLGAALLAGPSMGPRSDQKKVVVFGADGVDLRTLELIMQHTDLPNFQRLLDTGTASDLLAEPPFTPPSWATLATGKLPAGHGIDNWDRNVRETGSRAPLRLWALQAVTMFDIAEDLGFGSAHFEWPMVGRRASGLEGSVNRVAVFLLSFGERVPIFFLQAASITTDKRTRAYLTYRDNETGLKVLAHYFWRLSDPALFGMGVKSTDSAQHFYWWSLDPARYGMDPEVAETMEDHIPSIYRITDRMLGDFLNDPNTDVIFFSDHGSAGIPTDRKVQFHVAYFPKLSPFLETWGFTQRGEDGAVDFAGSSLYDCSDKNLHQQICVNITEARSRAVGRGPGDLLEDGRSAIEAAADRFQRLRFQDSGEPLFPGDYGTRWNGADLTSTWIPMAAGGEPVFFPNFDDYDMNLGAGFYVVPFEDGFMERVITDGEKTWLASEILESIGWEGTHTAHGMIAVHGPSFAEEVRLQVRTVDLVPTVLHLLSLAVADDMDGRVVTEAFATSSDAERRQISRVATYEGSVERKLQEGVTAYEEKLNRTLKSLGYID